MSLGDPYAHDPSFSQACDQAHAIEELQDRLAEQARRLEVLGQRARLHCGHAIGELVVHSLDVAGSSSTGSHCRACMAAIAAGDVPPPQIGPYDEECDLIIIEGTLYAGALLRRLGAHIGFPGDLLRIEKRAEDGAITLTRFSPQKLAELANEAQRLVNELRNEISTAARE